MKTQPAAVAMMKECPFSHPVYVPELERRNADIRMNIDGFIFPLCRGALCAVWDKHEGMKHSDAPMGRCGHA